MHFIAYSHGKSSWGGKGWPPPTRPSSCVQPVCKPRYEPEYVVVRVVAPSKHLDRLRDQSGLDPITDSVSLSIHRRDGLVRGWSPLLSFCIRLCTLGPGRWSWSGRIIALHGIVVVLHLAVQYGLKVYCGCPSETLGRESPYPSQLHGRFDCSGEIQNGGTGSSADCVVVPRPV